MIRTELPDEEFLAKKEEILILLSRLTCDAFWFNGHYMGKRSLRHWAEDILTDTPIDRPPSITD